MFPNTIEATHANVLDSTDPHYLLDWATSQFAGSLALATSLGNQTLVIIDMLYRMGRSVPTFCIDTNLLFEETYKLWSEIEMRYGIRIERLHSPLSLEDQAAIAVKSCGKQSLMNAVEFERCCHSGKGFRAWAHGLQDSAELQGHQLEGT